MTNSELIILVHFFALLMGFMVNLALMAYQWGKFQQIVSDLKEVVGEVRVALLKGEDKFLDHGNRIISLETHAQIDRRGHHG